MMICIIIVVYCCIIARVDGYCDASRDGNFGDVSASEISALRDIYDSTNGPGWFYCTECVPWNFSSPSPCIDQWAGIGCTLIGETTYIYQVSLSNMLLNGSIPQSIGSFPQLCLLIFDQNPALTGTIPKEIGDLTSLEYLELSGNGLVGTIPAELGNLKLLEELYLPENKLNGTIPSELTKLSLLTTLEVFFNRLTGSIPETIGSMTSLESLNLYENQFNGSLPDQICWLQNLEYLMLSSNSYTGTIPENIGNMTALSEIAIDFNHFNGSIPASISKLTKMNYLYIDNNKLTGTIPEDIGNMEHLYMFHFADMMIRGHLPDSMGRMKYLQDLQGSYNQLSGSLPRSLQNCSFETIDLSYNQLSQHLPNLFSHSSLSQLQLKYNRLSGPLPDVTYSKSLVSFDVSHNLLSQHIPASLFNNGSRLFTLNLEYNRLTGPIPEQMNFLSKGSEIKLDNNQLSGSIPSVSGLSKILTFLDLSVNHLTGTISSDLGYFKELLNLLLSSNHLTGRIPTELSLLKSLTVLGLNENVLSGTIPSSLSQLNSLTLFFVYQNVLSGQLINVFNPTTQSNLYFVDVSNNQFTGNIPSGVFQIASLHSFAAVGNCFTGSIPSDICGADNLTSLALDGLMSASSCQEKFFPAWTSSYGLPNTIQGGFPVCLFSMVRLESLHLSGNGLTGTINADIVIGDRLRDLSLSHNNLKGSIPSPIQNHNWSNLDLSYNKFRGTLDAEVYSLYGINGSLSLQVNRMSGKIPSSLRTAESITILDGNLFACNAERSDLPVHDSYAHIYECGSNTFNFTMFFWVAVVALVLLLGLLMVVLADFSSSFNVVVKTKLCVERWMRVFSDDEKHLHIKSLGQFVSVLRWTCITITLVILLICMPVYLILSEYYDTYTYEYAWRTTACYLSGEVPASVLVILFMLFGIVVIYGYREWKTCLRSMTSEELPFGSLSDPNKSWTLFQYFSVSGIVVFNVVLVTAVNILYVYVDHNYSSDIVRITQLSVAMFKIVWKNFIVRLLLNVTNPESSGVVKDDRDGSLLSVNSRSSSNHHSLSLAVFVTIFNNIAAPFIATCYVSTNCFYNVVTSPPKVVVSYEYAMCTYGEFNGNFTPCSIFLDATTHSTSYDPPYIYSYQCSSTFITTYSSIYVFMFTMEAFFIPLVMWCLALYHHKYGGAGRNSCGEKLEQLVTVEAALIPKILQTPSPDAQHKPQKRVPYFECAVFTVKLLNMYSILCTFGVILPPVAAVCCVAVWSSTINIQLLIGRFMVLSLQNRANDLVTELDNDCRHAGIMFVSSVWMLVPVTVVFYALLLFDTLGDSVGWKKALWGPLLVILGSTAVWLLFKYSYCKKWITTSSLGGQGLEGVDRKLSADGYSIIFSRVGDAEYSPLDTDNEMNKVLRLSDIVINQ